MKYCVDCGQALPDAAKFCSKCGVEQPHIRVAAEADSDCGEQGHTVYLNIIRKKDGSVALDKESVAKMSGMFMEKLALFVNGVMQGAFHKRGLFLETMTTEDGFEVLTYESEKKLIKFFLTNNKNELINFGDFYCKPIASSVQLCSKEFSSFLKILYGINFKFIPIDDCLSKSYSCVNIFNEIKQEQQTQILQEKEDQFINDLASKIVDTEAFKNALKNNTSNFDVENLTQAILQGLVKNGIISSEILNNLNEILSEQVYQ